MTCCFLSHGLTCFLFGRTLVNSVSLNVDYLLTYSWGAFRLTKNINCIFKIKWFRKVCTTLMPGWFKILCFFKFIFIQKHPTYFPLIFCFIKNLNKNIRKTETTLKYQINCIIIHHYMSQNDWTIARKIKKDKKKRAKILPTKFM